MSTWTNEKHENIREAVEKYRGEDGVLGVPPRLMGEALDEIDRLRALTTITDDMVERAAGVIWAGTHVARTPDTLPSAADTLRGGDWYRRNARAALEAALNPGEGQ